ncbi:MAG: type III pantothenate kinase [Firmicutes bacterium]|nr:type III pantothenate kinase [Bacillota bacterium]
MILAIDIGNTNIVMGGITDGKIEFIARTSTDRIKTADQYGIQIKNILELYNIDIKKIDGSIIASVVPPVLNAMKGAVELVTGSKPLIVGPGVKTGLNIVMDNPASVGADRIVCAIAGLSMHKPPLVMIDMGTATTIDVVDENKNYIGGCIMPGLKSSLDALSEKAAQLPEISLEEPKSIIGKNTVDCMRSGFMFGFASMLDGCIDRVEEHLGKKANVIITGGLSRFIKPLCRREMTFADDLLLTGLYIIYKKNA